MSWKTGVRNFFYRHLYGVLGTLVFHLAVVLVFMLIKVSATYRERADMIIFEFTAEPVPGEEIVPEEREVEEQDPDERFWHNIAVNQARTAKEEFDLNEFVRQVQQELLEEGTTRPENWEEGNLRNNEEALQLAASPEPEEKSEEERNRLAELADNYTGPTNISYYLPDRDGIYLSLPIYKCMNGGLVVIDIEVNPEGYVVSASVNREQSDSDDPCLHTSALEAAGRSRFSILGNGPSRQAGSITYRFQKQ